MSCASLRCSGTARVNEGSHSFICHPQVYPQVEWAMPAFNPPARQHHRTLAGTHFLSRRGQEAELAWVVWWDTETAVTVNRGHWRNSSSQIPSASNRAIISFTRTSWDLNPRPVITDISSRGVIRPSASLSTIANATRSSVRSNTHTHQSNGRHFPWPTELRNELPKDAATAPSLPIFRRRLNTYLLQKSYPDILIWHLCWHLQWCL